MQAAVTADALLPPAEESVAVRLEPAGKDLALGAKLVTMKAGHLVSKLIEFVRKKSKAAEDVAIHIIVGDAFIAAPGERIGDLAARFSQEGVLPLKFTTQSLYG